MTRPLRHLSVRVPWHDSAWNGHVCAAPTLNGACLKLNGIAESRNDAEEEERKGLKITDIDPASWPPCVAQHMPFMASFEYSRYISHPYSNSQRGTHSHYKPTLLRHPPYSTPVVPFYWMLQENMSELAQEYGLDIHVEREPNLGPKSAKTWVQGLENQQALLECFRDHIKPEKSLCFFYAKHVPFVEDPGAQRVLVGVGRVLNISPPQEYDYSTTDLSGKLRSLVWDLMVHHSIRPDSKDGFLLPYHAAINKAESDPSFNPMEIVALTPSDRLTEFSHVSQHVTHDAAIESLLSCSAALHNAQKAGLAGNWSNCFGWIDDRLNEIWKARGPYPGLGSSLSAFGLELGGFIAHELCSKQEENSDPWPLVSAMFSDPSKHLSSDLADTVGDTLREVWVSLPEERKDLLKLLSRFDLSKDQASLLYVQEERSSKDINLSDRQIIENPYRIYEHTRLTSEAVDLWTVDRGVFPHDEIRTKFPLPEPTGLKDGVDGRRVRAICVSLLEDAADKGNTLLPQSRIVKSIRDLDVQPGCPVNADILNVVKNEFRGVIEETQIADGDTALQLERLSQVGDVIRNSLERRIGGERLQIHANWQELLDDYLSKQDITIVDEQEERARQEKVAALEELSRSPLSVLVGPAGTGKTTLLSILCMQPEIASGHVLLLAPTGKARVRMEQSAKDLGLKGYTIAQFLTPSGYDVETGRYKLPKQAIHAEADTVIVDEASMLTEEMLASLLQSLEGVKRLILIGDPRQLPPIGTGRPFVDIVNRLAPDSSAEQLPRVSPGYGELTIRLRQAGQEREDLQLAEWFSGKPVAPGEDEISDILTQRRKSKYVRLIRWDSPGELRSCMIDALVEELNLDGPDDIAGFDKILGGNHANGYSYFNPQWKDRKGAAASAESWQVLSPIRSSVSGVGDLNRLIHKQFRQHTIEASQRRGDQRKLPEPKGPEQIVYGDKVINVINTKAGSHKYKHRKVYPNKDAPYIANGEIGMVEGYFWKNQDRNKGWDFRWKLEVEFSSQLGFKYSFTSQDFGEEGSPVLELAYALTVHKSQGSEFGVVFLVLPMPCQLLSRELLYTALTRQKERVIILHQGDANALRKYSHDDQSEIARRLTNLFDVPSPVEVDGHLYEDSLIHRTSRGEMVRSKSEVIIANQLASTPGLEYEYERALTIDGTTKYPDFTIQDQKSGQTVYWEHCSMLHVPSYKRRWEEKLAWYRSHEVIPQDEGQGSRGTLVISEDGPDGSIDSAHIKKLIASILDA